MRKQICVFFIAAFSFLVFANTHVNADAQSNNDINISFQNYIFDETSSKTLRSAKIPSADVRRIVTKHLGDVTRTVVRAEGMDYKFTLTGQEHESHAGILVLSYQNAKQAEGVYQQLAKITSFKRTKILTPVVTTRLQSQIIIVYTESAGNKDLVKRIKSFPAHLHSSKNSQ